LSFFAELRRRNVIRMAGLYLVGAWVIVQIAETLLPAFDVPAWVLRAIIIVMALGFLPALVFAWIFEITPEGIKRDIEVDPARSIAPQTGQRMNVMIAVLLALALVYFAIESFVLAPTRGALDVAASLKSSAPLPANAVAPVDSKSIAVLPFENLSEEKANAYFADGIQDEILTSLARIGQLKVISRTSTRSYSSSPDNIAEIAQQLGVAHILEGSVQKAGNRVRVIVQLIDASSDNHLWAETYDRALDDVFAVQSEVAQKIAASLQAQLTQDERSSLSTRPTSNSAAYDAYLRGKALEGKGFELAISRQVAAAYAEAVRLDPEFALAWASLAGVESYLYGNGVDPEKFTADSIKHAVDDAMRLGPTLIETQLAQGMYHYRVLLDLPGAAQAFQSVLLREPNNATALRFLGLVERRQGKWEQALQHLQQSAERDPRNAGLMTAIGGETLGAMRRFDEARQWLERARALAPDSARAIAYIAGTYQLEGRLEDAANILAAVPLQGEDPQVALARSWQALLERRYDAAIAELQPVLALPDTTLSGWGPQLTINLGYAQRLTGDSAKARVTFQRLIDSIGTQGADKVDDTLMPIMLAQAYAGIGKEKLALKQAQNAVDLYRDDAIFRPFAEQALAQVQAMNGDHDAAIAGLAISLKVPSGVTTAQLRLDPIWDPLRKDPRFEALLTSSVAEDEGVPAQ
jgi:TolB-like protein/Tfp pilus assembly protein PilF